MASHRRTSGTRNLITTVLCIAFVVAGILCATRFYDVQTRKARLLEESRQLQAQKQALIDKNNAILAQGSRGSDAAYVEGVARNKLDMVYPGEIVFRVTGE
ncbi:MAG: septum formation initiator family protein [Clostridiales bacterium]|nr:septum formation initiator family protein [Clostridiales bacterium]